MTDERRPNRDERITLLAAAVRGLLTGASHAVANWLIGLWTR